MQAFKVLECDLHHVERLPNDTAASHKAVEALKEGLLEVCVDQAERVHESCCVSAVAEVLLLRCHGIGQRGNAGQALSHVGFEQSHCRPYQGIGQESSCKTRTIMVSGNLE